MKKTLMMVIMILTISTSTIPIVSIHAQAQVKCGDIIEGEFLKESESFKYSIPFAPGDSIQVSAKPFGDTLKIAIGIYTPTNKFLAGSKVQGNVIPDRTPSVDSGILSGRGLYTIIVANADIFQGEASTMWHLSGTGPFTVYIGCTLKDGTVIKPGDAAQTSSGSSTDNNGKSSLPPFSGVGFPGLVSVDFKDALELPLIEGQPVVAAIAGNAVFISKLNATAGEVYAVTVARAGKSNASLGMTVLDPNNVAVFNVAMGTMDSFTVNVTIDSTGTYTLGFYNAPLGAGGENAAGAYTITVKKQ